MKKLTLNRCAADLPKLDESPLGNAFSGAWHHRLAKLGSKASNVILLLLAIPVVLVLLFWLCLAHIYWILCPSKRPRSGWVNGYGHMDF